MIFNLEGGGGKATITYTGAHTTQTITSGGKKYLLYTLTGSGTMTIKNASRESGIWVCGGGAGGTNGGGSYTGAYGGNGGGGGYAKSYNGKIANGTYTVLVGTAGGKSSVGDLVIANGATGKNGGTGGGGGGKGDGKSKYPFDDTINFEPHCGGGGGGRWQFTDISQPYPSSGSEGNGGTNGGNGGSSGGYTGGAKGGGNGGYPGSNGGAATFYGSGGGGGGGMASTQTSTSSGAGGAGYQGVVYIRVPA